MIRCILQPRGNVLAYKRDRKAATNGGGAGALTAVILLVLVIGSLLYLFGDALFGGSTGEFTDVEVEVEAEAE